MGKGDAQRALGLAIGFICTSLFWIGAIHFLNRLHHERKTKVEDLESRIEEKDLELEQRVDEVRQANQQAADRQRDIDVLGHSIDELRYEVTHLEEEARQAEADIRAEAELVRERDVANIREQLARAIRQEREKSGQFENLRQAATLVRQKFDRTNQEFSTTLETLAEADARTARLESELSRLREDDAVSTRREEAQADLTDAVIDADEVVPLQQHLSGADDDAADKSSDREVGLVLGDEGGIEVLTLLGTDAAQADMAMHDFDESLTSQPIQR